jgi:hypothetical protein
VTEQQRPEDQRPVTDAEGIPLDEQPTLSGVLPAIPGEPEAPDPADAGGAPPPESPAAVPEPPASDPAAAADEAPQAAPEPAPIPEEPPAPVAPAPEPLPPAPVPPEPEPPPVAAEADAPIEAVGAGQPPFESTWDPGDGGGASAAQRPEVLVGAAFVGGLALAILIRRLGR